MAKNVLGGELVACSMDPLTGFFRNGKCDTRADDEGMHTICVQVTAPFLAFSKAKGNDLSTPVPEWGFPGLEPGDFWCLCLSPLDTGPRRRCGTQGAARSHPRLCA